MQTGDPQVMQSESQVFLAYSHLDSQQMQLVYHALIDAGLTVWTDEGLVVGTPSWENAIEQAIDASRWMVVLLSPHAKQSKWVRIEIEYALDRGLGVFPLLLQGDKQESVPLLLYAVQFEDGRKDLAAACSRLTSILVHSEAQQTQLPKPSSPYALAEIRRRALAERRNLLAKQLDAAYRQFNSTLDAAQRVTIEQGINDLVDELTQVEAQLAILESEAPPLRTDFEWVTIPKGEFLMGEGTQQHAVYLPAYRIARYPVTNAQYKLFVAATEHAAPAHWQDGHIPEHEEHHPVTCVSWQDAQAFCRWAGVQLPSEAQWEKAARYTDGRTYPWGEAKPSRMRCNFDDNEGGTTAVGHYSPDGDSQYGLADVAGNVWEWTSTLDRPYPYVAKDGREDPSAPGRRMLRGGAWFTEGLYVSCAIRIVGAPDDRRSPFGFRVAQ